MCYQIPRNRPCGTRHQETDAVLPDTRRLTLWYVLHQKADGALRVTPENRPCRTFDTRRQAVSIYWRGSSGRRVPPWC